MQYSFLLIKHHKCQADFFVALWKWLHQQSSLGKNKNNNAMRSMTGFYCNRFVYRIVHLSCTYQIFPFKFDKAHSIVSMTGKTNVKRLFVRNESWKFEPFFFGCFHSLYFRFHDLRLMNLWCSQMIRKILIFFSLL